MNQLTLYSSLLSANGRKVEAVCRQLKANVIIRTVNIYAGEGREPSYLQVNPLGKIPALVADELILLESNAISTYLCTLYDEEKVLSGRTLDESATINQWLFWESAQWQPALTSVMAQQVGHRLLPDMVAEPTAAPDWSAPIIAQQLEYLNQCLSDRSFIVNDSLSLADFSVAAMTSYFSVSAFPFDDFEHIARWYQAMMQVPSWRETEHDLWKV